MKHRDPLGIRTGLLKILPPDLPGDGDGVGAKGMKKGICEPLTGRVPVLKVVDIGNNHRNLPQEGSHSRRGIGPVHVAVNDLGPLLSQEKGKLQQAPWMESPLEGDKGDGNPRLFKPLCQRPPGVDADNLAVKLPFKLLEHRKETLLHPTHSEVRDHPDNLGLIHQAAPGRGLPPSQRRSPDPSAKGPFCGLWLPSSLRACGLLQKGKGPL